MLIRLLLKHLGITTRKKWLYTLKFPKAKTLPSSVSAAVWLSPAVTWTTFSSPSTKAGSVSVPSSEVSRPRAPSSLQPNVYNCTNTHNLRSGNTDELFSSLSLKKKKKKKRFGLNKMVCIKLSLSFLISFYIGLGAYKSNIKINYVVMII